ncbi:hypothetical protein PTMSG1_06127 [Pyrenophora teres f. maculata]|nr:hypothetical protein PTMSG1_06127 [Pyrenophora teres f. maculata]
MLAREACTYVMKNYLAIPIILLIPAVSAWDSCYCTGDQPNADRSARECCVGGDGVSFPNTQGDVLGSWDGLLCSYSGAVTTQNTENQAIISFSDCCKPTGGNTITGGNCCTKQADGKCK